MTASDRTTTAPHESGFALLDHTADIGVRAWGPTPAAAFNAAAQGMYAIALGGDVAGATGPAIERTIAVSGDTWPDLLVNWLAELLYLLSVEGLVARTSNFPRARRRAAPPPSRESPFKMKIQSRAEKSRQ